MNVAPQLATTPRAAMSEMNERTCLLEENEGNLGVMHTPSAKQCNVSWFCGELQSVTRSGEEGRLSQSQRVHQGGCRCTRVESSAVRLIHVGTVQTTGTDAVQ